MKGVISSPAPVWIPLCHKATEKGTFFKTKSVPFSMQQRKDAK